MLMGGVIRPTLSKETATSSEMTFSLLVLGFGHENWNEVKKT